MTKEEINLIEFLDRKIQELKNDIIKVEIAFQMLLKEKLLNNVIIIKEENKE